MNGLTLVALIAVVVGVVVAYRAGTIRGRRAMTDAPLPPPPRPAPLAVPATTSPPKADPGTVAPDTPRGDDPLARERVRLVLSYEAEAQRLHARLASADASSSQLRTLAADRVRLFDELAGARAETARYRQIVVDIENNAPPPILESPTAPDDLKLIVGIGPVLERMLQQLGISTYRQIARWSERDVDDFDARLSEFPGRIRRDDWVTQARALHQSKYGESAVRERI